MVTLTLSPPIILQMRIYQTMLFFPHLHVWKESENTRSVARTFILSPRRSEDYNDDRGDDHDAPPHHKPHGEE